jgi:hypothetical protein
VVAGTVLEVRAESFRQVVELDPDGPARGARPDCGPATGRDPAPADRPLSMALKVEQRLDAGPAGRRDYAEGLGRNVGDWPASASSKATEDRRSAVPGRRRRPPGDEDRTVRMVDQLLPDGSQ